jgi:hypothetical protein
MIKFLRRNWNIILPCSILAAFLIAAAYGVYGCATEPTPPPTPSKNEIEYKGSHLLRQIGSLPSSTDISVTRSFFYIDADSHSDLKISFAWQGNDGIYRFTTQPLTDVRVQLNDSVNTPFVKFKWNDYGLLYTVIVVNPKDWPVDIHMPDVGAKQ